MNEIIKANEDIKTEDYIWKGLQRIAEALESINEKMSTKEPDIEKIAVLV